MENDIIEIRKRSRRYKIIRLFVILIIFCLGYVSIMIPLLGEKFSPFIAFYLTTSGALIGTVGTWVGFVSAKQKDQ